MSDQEAQTVHEKALDQVDYAKGRLSKGQDRDTWSSKVDEMPQNAEQNLMKLMNQVHEWEDKTKEDIGEKTDQFYKSKKKDNTFIYFYHLKGTDIDSETGEYIQNTDLVRMLKQIATNYGYV